MRKKNKIWVDKGTVFYNSFSKKWLKDNRKEMYPTHKEGNVVVAETLITTLKNKIYKHMTAVSKNMYIDKLDDIFFMFFFYNINFTRHKSQVKKLK